jgi:hypothetical protein
MPEGAARRLAEIGDFARAYDEPGSDVLFLLDIIDELRAQIDDVSTAVAWAETFRPRMADTWELIRSIRSALAAPSSEGGDT